MRGSIGYRVFLGILCALLLAGCSGGLETAWEPIQQSQSPETALVELDGLPTPEGVDSDLFAELKEALAQALAERFGASGMDTAGKLASAPPMGEASATVLSYNAGAATLSWRYYSTGDYNQDGLVGINDLTPLGQHYGEGSPLGAGQPFPPDSLGAAIDGNGDGVINISDITQIGQNYGVFVVGYNVYTSTDEGDYPASGSDDNGPETSQIGYVALADATSLTDERKLLEFALPEDTVAGYYWVRPTDGETDGTPSSLAQITEGDLNTPPIAVLSASPADGLVPLTVSFHAFSSIDPDGVISAYHWDYDGLVGPLEMVDTGDQGWTEHTYAEAGDYLALLAVVDDDGGIAEDFATIRVREPTPPVAFFDWSPSSGPAPLKVSLDASGSYDPDGYIVRYEWDWNKDGKYNYDAGSEPTADIYYYEPALYTYTIQLRVTDNDGLTATGIREVVVQEGATWHTEVAVSAAHVQHEDGISRIGATGNVIDADGYPAFFIHKTTAAGMDSTDSLHYMRALDPYGTAWDEPVDLITYDKDIYSYTPYVASIQGRPAMYYKSGPLWDPYKDTWLLLADDEAGSSWPEPFLMEEGQVLPYNMSIVNDRLMFRIASAVYRAVDELGTSWEKYTTSLNVGSGNYIGEVTGNPAIGLRYYDDLMYIRSFDGNGATWPGFPIILDSMADVQHTPSMVMADGRPIISYYDSTLRRLMLIRAEDSLGESWGEPQALVHWTEGRQAMTLWQGRPVVMYQDHNTEDYMLIIANNEEGTNWGLPVVVDIEYPTIPDQTYSSYNVSWLTLVGDRPAVTVGYVIEANLSVYTTYTGSCIVMYH